MSLHLLTLEMRRGWCVSHPPCMRKPQGDPPKRVTSLALIPRRHPPGTSTRASVPPRVARLSPRTPSSHRGFRTGLNVRRRREKHARADVITHDYSSTRLSRHYAYGRERIENAVDDGRRWRRARDYAQWCETRRWIATRRAPHSFLVRGSRCTDSARLPSLKLSPSIAPCANSRVVIRTPSRGILYIRGGAYALRKLTNVSFSLNREIHLCCFILP